DREDSKMAGSHRRALYRRERGPSILTPSDTSAILRFVIASGVQTWGTDVVALQHYWRRADELGYARVTYGDGLWGWTHDGWTLLAALALGDTPLSHRSRCDLCLRRGRPPSLVARQARGGDRSPLAGPSRPALRRGRRGARRRSVMAATRH